jgi:hypothetical protein
MSVNMFDSPIAGQYMNTYTRLPFQEIAVMGDQLRKRSESAAATADGLAAQLNVEALEEDRGRRDELTGQLEEEVSKIYDLYKSDPYQANEVARRIGTKLNKELTRGELAAIKSRYAQKQQALSNLDKIYRDPKSNYNPRLYDFYANKIKVEDLAYDPNSGRYGSVIAPTQDKLYSVEDLTKHYKTVLDGISADQVLLSGAPKELASVPFSQLLEMPGSKKYINFDKVKNALIGATDASIVQSANVMGEAMGRGENQGSFIKDDGSFNLETDLGRMLQGLAGGKAFTQTNRGVTRTLTDNLGLHGAKRTRDNQYVISGDSNVVKRGAVLDANGDPITNSKDFTNYVQTSKNEISNLEKELNNLGNVNPELRQEYISQIENKKRALAQNEKVLAESIDEAIKRKGWKKQRSVDRYGTVHQYVDKDGNPQDLYPNYLINEGRLNDDLAKERDNIIKEKLKGRDITLNRYLGTGDKQLDQYYASRLYDYASTTDLYDNDGNKVTLDEISKDMDPAELNRLKTGKIKPSFTETPDSDFNTYGMQFTTTVAGENKTYTMKAPLEYEQRKTTNKDGSKNQVRTFMNKASLDLNEAMKLPESKEGVPSKSGLGNYYFDSYNGKALTGTEYIFVPAKGTKLDMNEDGIIEIADGKTAISIATNKNALTKIFMLNQE